MNEKDKEEVRGVGGGGGGGGDGEGYGGDMEDTYTEEKIRKIKEENMEDTEMNQRVMISKLKA